MCIIIVAAVPPNVDARFRSSLSDTEFFVDVSVLLEKVKRVCAELNPERRTIIDFPKHHGMSLNIKLDRTPGKRSKQMVNLQAPIPKRLKSKGGK